MKLWCHENPFSNINYNEKDTVKTPCLFSFWSIHHFLTGGFLYCILAYYFKKISKTIIIFIVLLIHSIYEFKDMLFYLGVIEDSHWSNNSPLNTFGDTICCLIGSLLVMKLFKTKDIFVVKIISVIILIFTIFSIFSLIIRYNQLQHRLISTILD
jgi:hypothetical protein